MSQNGPDPKESLRQSFSQRTAEELAEICSELVLSYVVKKQAPSVDQLGMIAVPSNLREMDFPQLITWLKHNLTLPELERFEISGTNISLRVGEQLLPLDSARFGGTPNAPASATSAPPAAPAAPTPPAAEAGSSPSSPPRPSTPAPPPAPDTSSSNEDETLSERFSMLEID